MAKTKTKCTPKKKITIKNSNETKSSFIRDKGYSSKDTAKKKAASIRKKTGKRAIVRKGCGKFQVYIGPKCKTYKKVRGRKRKAS